MVINKVDLKHRKKYATYEVKRKALQALVVNQDVDTTIRWWAQIEKTKLPRQSSLSRVHNYCIQTNRSRSILKFYKLSRLRMRKLASRGVLAGLRKSSW